MTPKTGGCHCGKIRCRIRADDLSDAAICHCRDCRLTAGAEQVAWVTIPRAAFEWTTGEPAVYQSSANARRRFCRDCGCLLLISDIPSPDAVDLVLATLDDAAQYPPTCRIWTGSALPWTLPDDGLPRYEEEGDDGTS